MAARGSPRKVATDTVCANGHPWSEGNNLYLDPNRPGHRVCRECRRIRDREITRFKRQFRKLNGIKRSQSL